MEESKNTNRGFKLLLIMFAILALFFVKEENQEKVINIFNSFTATEKELQYDKVYEAEVNDKLYYFNGAITKWDGNNISFLNADGSNLWKKEFNFTEPQIMFSEKNIYIMDKSTGDIYLLDNKGNTTSRIQLDSPIFNIKEDNDQILIHLKDDNGESLKIIDKEGKKLALKEIQNILTYSVNNNASKYIISTLAFKDGGLNSKLMLYSIAGDEIDSVQFPNEIILFTQMTGSKIITLTDTSLNLIEDGNILWTKEYPLIKDIYLDKDKIYLLYGDNIEIINLKGEIEKKITFGIDYNRVLPMDKYITLYGKRDILVLYNGEELLKFKADEDIIDVKGNNNLIAIHYINSIEIYDIINKE